MVHNHLFSFFENMSVIIAALYLITKLYEYLDLKDKVKLFYKLAPLLYGALTLLVMLHPFVFSTDNILDLRHVPIFFVAFHAGWRHGLLVVILPIIYRYYVGGPFAFDGILFAIFLPLIVGSITHHRFKIVSEYSFIHLKTLMISFLIYEVIRDVSFKFVYGIPIHVSLLMTILGVITIFIITIVVNDGLKNIKLKTELLTLSRYDYLTALPNVRYFKEKAEALLRNGEKLAIAMVDIDHFKQYNDTHGHPIGDIALQCVGNLLDLTTRENDIVARYGGEEFVILLRHADDPEQTRRIVENIRRVIENYYFPGEKSTTEQKLTISIGVSHSNHSSNLHQIIDQADQALYESKRNNRNQVTFYQA